MESIIPATPSVGRIVAENPGRARVFKRPGIDYCCCGRQALGEACAARGIDSTKALEDIEDCDLETSYETRPNWERAPLAELIDHIFIVHHGTARREMPRLSRLIAKVANADGSAHPELQELSEVFAALWDEMEGHMAKEELFLFPACVALESAANAGRPFGCGDVSHPLHRMRLEHEDTAAALARLEQLTDGYTLPPGGCASYEAMLQGLAALAADLHVHIHEENDILFPRAIALQAGVAKPSGATS